MNRKQSKEAIILGLIYLIFYIFKYRYNTGYISLAQLINKTCQIEDRTPQENFQKKHPY